MSCPVPKRLCRWAAQAAWIIAVSCLARTSFAEQSHHFAAHKKHKAPQFALQVSLRDSVKKISTAAFDSTDAESPTLDYRLMTSLDGDSTDFSTTVSNADRFGSLRLRPAAKETPLPHLLSWMEGWRMDIERGLFRPLRHHAFRLALAYSDIFETRSHPDKGGHGPGIVFRYDFRRPSVRK